ncbi:VapC toxin family PIN domain ribonuclease [Pleurocapsa sp. CCALA 161]|uniref:type II toxin-antitoxin system tRNA(fMet)-specific endonuclease VapC n=1 Tax=Pleurocapsa sp. CCALA 161 TaxID=2107688 RepID=UPI000D052DAB|nr:type II toxin-antitoxin system VapC family toxin [Pleurocapsa sp. CCALA 161]PSB08775.1 VapC toxin family PIN domain ribonuclease [Pleurocapsa sp. CCALA 161]
MKFLLDTNICIYIIKQKPLELLQKFNTYQVGEIGISAITVAELEFGVQKSQFPTRNQQALTQFILPLQIVDFDHAAAVIYGNIRAMLEKEGTPIGSLDTQIAAHALSLQVILITNNVKEFSRVPSLQLDNWVS